VPVALGLVDLGVLLALGFLIALSYAYRYSVGAAIVGIANALGSVRLPGFVGGGRVLGFAADELLKIDNSIRHAIGVGIEAMQATWNDAISYTATAVHWVGKEIASISHDTAQAIEGLHVTSVTNVYRKVNPGLAAKVGALVATVAALGRRIAYVAEQDASYAKHKTIAVEHAIAVPDVGAIPRTIPSVKELERAGEAALARAKEFARRFGPAALLGTIIASLARIGLGWTRCSNVGKTGKQICGMNPSLLESLLADTLLIVGTVSLVEFAEGMQGITGDIASASRAFWRA
jgi:hypothetical protein